MSVRSFGGSFTESDAQHVTIGECTLPQAISADASEPEKVKSRRNSTNSSEDLLALVEQLIAKEKGEDITVISLQGKSTIADYMVIASGRSNRQVASIADKLCEEIKKEGYGVPRIEGKSEADWVLIDGSDVIIHLFRPEVREFYQLEKLWSEETAPQTA